MCEKFIESGKKINPLSGRSIKKDGPMYKLFMKKCKLKELTLSGSLLKSKNNNLDYLDLSVFTGKKPKPPSSPFIPKRIEPFIPRKTISEPLRIESSVSMRPSVPRPTIKYPGNPGVKIYPMWVQPGPSTSEFNGIKYTIQPRKFISFKGKEFKVGSKANFDNTGSQAIITNIGLKQITLRKDLISKENRLTIENFLTFNT